MFWGFFHHHHHRVLIVISITTAITTTTTINTMISSSATIAAFDIALFFLSFVASFFFLTKVFQFMPQHSLYCFPSFLIFSLLMHCKSIVKTTET